MVNVAPAISLLDFKIAWWQCSDPAVRCCVQIGWRQHIPQRIVVHENYEAMSQQVVFVLFGDDQFQRKKFQFFVLDNSFFALPKLLLAYDMTLFAPFWCWYKTSPSPVPQASGWGLIGSLNSGNPNTDVVDTAVFNTGKSNASWCMLVQLFFFFGWWDGGIKSLKGLAILAVLDEFSTISNES